MKKTELKKFEIVSDIQRHENSLCSDLISGGEKIGWPIAHYIGTNNFDGDDSKIQNALGLAGYFPVAHKDFNDFYGSLKGGNTDYLKFKSLESRTKREFDACNDATSKDVIICPWDSHYKPRNHEKINLDKIENEGLILDSIELAKNLNKKGLKNKVDMVIYDKGLYDVEYLRDKISWDILVEEDGKYLKQLDKLGKKYGISFIEKIDLPSPFLLYEHLRNLNTNLFSK